MTHFSERTLNWGTVAKLGNNNLVRKSYIYLFVVPVLARLLSELKSPFRLLLDSGYEVIIPLELPFNWTLFFFAAVAFTVGTITFTLRAPLIFKEDQSFGEFEAKKKTALHLKWYLDDLGISDQYILFECGVDVRSIQSQHGFGEAPGEIITALARSFAEGKVSQDKKIELELYYDYWRTQTELKVPLQELFWKIFDYARKTNIRSLWLSMITYSLGLVLFVYVIVLGIIDVVVSLLH